MKTKNIVLTNASWIIGARLAQAIINLIINMLTARYLGPSNYGVVNYAASIVAFFVPIMQLGITNILVQELIEHKENEGEILGTAIVLNVLSAICCVGGVTAFSVIANYGETETIIVCVLYSILLIFQASEVALYWFQAHLLSKYSSIVTLIAFIIVAIYKSFLLITSKGIYWFSVSYALDYLILTVGLLLVYFRLGGQRFRFSRTTAMRMFHRGKYYIISSMMVTIFAQTDKVMLKLMIDSTSVGYYSAAVTCAGMTGFVFAAIIDSFRPTIFEAQKISKDYFEYRMIQLYSLITFLSLAQSVFMTAFARIIISILYGLSYQPAISALTIVVWYTTFSYYGAVRNIWILAEEKQRYLWPINLSGALVNIALNAVFIPLWKINGAAVASLLTQLFTNVLIGYVIRPIKANNHLIVRSLNPKVLMEILYQLRT